MSATVTPHAPLSESFRRSAVEERKVLIDRYREALARAEELRAEADSFAAKADRCLRAAREIGELLGTEDQLSLVNAGSELRGQRLREIAEDVLRRHFRDGEVLHYRDWAKLLTEEGYTIGGKNPNATFLTQIAEIRSVSRIGKRTGQYQVRTAA